MSYIYETAECADYELLRAYADYNMSHPTEAESIVWDILKSKSIDGHKFRRQHIIKDYIVDFVCLHKKLVIEIDGQYHLENQQLVKDKSRTEDLQHSGYTVIRFTNEEVVANTQEVLRNIKKALMEIIPSDKKKAQNAPKAPSTWRGLGEAVRADAFAVDAACSGNPGPMEYQGIDLATGARVFKRDGITKPSILIAIMPFYGFRRANVKPHLNAHQKPNSSFRLSQELRIGSKPINTVIPSLNGRQVNGVRCLLISVENNYFLR